MKTDTHDHHGMLQKIGTALGLKAGDDIHKKAIPEIHRLQAHNNVLRELDDYARLHLEAGDIEAAGDALLYACALTKEETMAKLEAEFDELSRRQMTPTAEMIIQQVHDEAGKHDEELSKPIVIHVDPHDYDALCDEEEAREAILGHESTE